MVLLFAIWSAGMGDSVLGVLPYLPVLAVCLVQFFRPTLLGWSLLAVPFAVYTVAVAVAVHSPFNEVVAFLLIGGLPTLALLWCWPKPVVNAGSSG